MIIKRCSRCKLLKARTAFYKVDSSHRQDKLSAYCKECCREDGKERYKKDPIHKLYVRAKLKYQITMSENEFREKLDNGCAICGRKDSTRRLNIDHNHTTGIVRDFLCQTCNAAIGMANDDPELLLKMAAYLEAHS